MSKHRAYPVAAKYGLPVSRESGYNGGEDGGAEGCRTVWLARSRRGEP